MMHRICAVVAVMLALAACSSGPGVKAPGDNELPVGDQGGLIKVGTPYQVAGQWYYPKEDPSYDQTGLASWYGDQFHGRATANGEVFNMNALTAAHKTLPMPSFVKVTNLENGRSLVLRVNDRGPFVDDRLIDVSRRAAQLLGFADNGLTRVRVQASDEKGRVIAPPDYAANKKGGDALGGKTLGDDKGGPADPTPLTVAAEVTDTAQYFVQLGAYSDLGNATRELARAEAAGLAAVLGKTTLDGQTIYRVRLGPYPSRRRAETQQRQLVAQGFVDARVALRAIN